MLLNDKDKEVINVMFDFITGEETTYEDFREYGEYTDEEVLDARDHFKFIDVAKKWRLVTGVVTPGGDPYYVCPVCENGGHLNGIESHKDWNFCPNCGTRLEYY